jgi:hypothetical protein
MACNDRLVVVKRKKLYAASMMRFAFRSLGRSNNACGNGESYPMNPTDDCALTVRD